MSEPASRVPSVFSTFRTPQTTLFQVHHQKTPQYAKTTPASVDFPAGHAFSSKNIDTFPPGSPQAISILETVQTFTQVLEEVLNTPSPEETPATEETAGRNKTTTGSQLPITSKTVGQLKVAFQTLQTQLQANLQELPELARALPKTLSQVLVRTAAFLEHLQTLEQKTLAERPVFEEGEVPTELPVFLKKEEAGELRRTIPAFVKNLKAALESLPPTASPEIKEAIEKYLQTPSVRKTFQEPQASQVPEKAPVTEEKVLPNPVSPIRPEIPTEPFLREGVLLQAGILAATPRKIEQNPLAPKELPEAAQSTVTPQTAPPKSPFTPPLLPQSAPEITNNEVTKQKETALPIQNPVVSAIPTPQAPLVSTPLPKEEITPVKTPPLPRELPEIALKQALQGSLPLLENLLAILQKQKTLPKEVIILLEKLPAFLVELRKITTAGGPVLAPEQTKELEELQKNLPVSIETLKAIFAKLPGTVPGETLEVFQKYLKTVPEREVLAFLALKQKVVLHPTAPIFQKEPEAAVKTQAPSQTEIPSPLQETPLSFELPETSLSEGEVAVGTRGEGKAGEVGSIPSEGAQVEHRPEREISKTTKESPVNIPVFTVREFKEQIKQVPPPPEFSTDIPFAFIVPYTMMYFPINTPFPEVKITPPDPWKDIIKDQGTGVKKKSSQMLAYVPKGDYFSGDPALEEEVDKVSLDSFAIGVYPVTNEQFAHFLTEQSKQKKIYVGDNGKVFSANKELLCIIKTGSPLSDIEAEPESDHLSFRPSDEKGPYPVVCVTYFGANAFCSAGGFRLPLESEWEKAASVKMNKENVLEKKFAYGCSRDSINPSLANYGGKDSLSEAGTTPVGLYNGKASFVKEGAFIQTSDAASPFGCYEMSGNVWEWTDTGEGSSKVIKGGSFISPEGELRAFTKKVKYIDSCDGYTGFRVALS